MQWSSITSRDIFSSSRKAGNSKYHDKKVSLRSVMGRRGEKEGWMREEGIKRRNKGKKRNGPSHLVRWSNNPFKNE
jgi:hypothetical protein